MEWQTGEVISIVYIVDHLSFELCIIATLVSTY